MCGQDQPRSDVCPTLLWACPTLAWVCPTLLWVCLALAGVCPTLGWVCRPLAWMFSTLVWVCPTLTWVCPTLSGQEGPRRISTLAGGNPGAIGWFLWSTPIEIPPQEVASGGDWLKICPELDSRVGSVRRERRLDQIDFEELLKSCGCVCNSQGCAQHCCRCV